MGARSPGRLHTVVVGRGFAMLAESQLYDSTLMDNDMATIQCLVLAQIFCLLKADYSRLLKYKGLAIGLSQRLGLHQSQKRFALGALTSETRKKVFWSLYTVDW